jgi:hypothetical protein
VEYETLAAWVAVPDAIQARVRAAFRRSRMGWEEHLRGGLHAATHAVANALPLFARSAVAPLIAGHKVTPRICALAVVAELHCQGFRF